MSRQAELAAAFGLLSRLPTARLAPGGTYADPSVSVWAYPLVGIVVGAIGGIVYALAAAIGVPPTIAGVLAFAALALATGAMHEDGLADTADGLYILLIIC